MTTFSPANDSSFEEGGKMSPFYSSNMKQRFLNKQYQRKSMASSKEDR